MGMWGRMRPSLLYDSIVELALVCNELHRTFHLERYPQSPCLLGLIGCFARIRTTIDHRFNSLYRQTTI